MTYGERVRAQIERRETDFIPVAGLGYAPEVIERVTRLLGDGSWLQAVRSSNHIRDVGAEQDVLIDWWAVPKQGAWFRDPFGSLWRVDGQAYHLETPALVEADLSRFRFPETSALFADRWRENALRHAGHHADAFLITTSSLLFEFSWSIRGFENVLTDCVADAVFYHRLLDMIVEMLHGVLDRLLGLPIHAHFFFDDFCDQRGVMIGRERWREFIRPRFRAIIDRIHAAGKFVILHSCGNVSELLPDLIDIGLDVLESVQPEAMDPYALKREYGSHIAFWRGVGTQRLLPFGTPDEIEAEVARLCEEMGRGGGYILGPAKTLLPETPAENAVAFTRACLGQMGVPFPPKNGVPA